MGVLACWVAACLILIQKYVETSDRYLIFRVFGWMRLLAPLSCGLNQPGIASKRQGLLFCFDFTPDGGREDRTRLRRIMSSLHSPDC